MAGRSVLGSVLLLSLPCRAQAPAHSAAGDIVAPWTKVPAVVVVGASANDARLPLVQDAVAFWNRSFAALGSAVRLGSVTQATERVKELAARPVTSPLSRGEVGIRALARGFRVRGKGVPRNCEWLHSREEALTSTLSPQAGRGRIVRQCSRQCLISSHAPLRRSQPARCAH